VWDLLYKTSASAPLSIPCAIEPGSMAGLCRGGTIIACGWEPAVVCCGNAVSPSRRASVVQGCMTDSASSNLVYSKLDPEM
jgi:hypothetical protein